MDNKKVTIWDNMRTAKLKIQQGSVTTDVITIDVWDTDKVEFLVKAADGTGHVGYESKKFALVILDETYPTVIVQGLTPKEQDRAIDMLDAAIHDPDETYRSLLAKAERGESLARMQLEQTEEDLGYYSETLSILKEGS